MYLILVITDYEAKLDLTNVPFREYMDQNRRARTALASVSSVLGHNMKHIPDGRSNYRTNIANRGRCHLLLVQIRRKVQIRREGSALCRCQSPMM